MRRYRAYLFDLYGTLVDIHTDEARSALWRAMAERFAAEGADYEPRALQEAYRRLCAAEEAAMKSAAPGGEAEIDISAVFAGLYAEKGLAADEALIARTAAAFRRLSTTHLRRYAGAEELLRSLRRQGSLVILLSNAQRLFTVPELERLGLTELFDGIFLSSDHGCKKPNSRFFAAPLAQFGLKPSDCLMIGNDPACDAWGANRAGMDCVYIRSALSPKPEGACPPCAARLKGMDLRRLRRLLTGGREAPAPGRE
ncbi:MAG: HAD family hydrolase [Oscillospiraceae bacterium]|nr:HAD family hydrolase [Oscillospiraceae bacterium]